MIHFDWPWMLLALPLPWIVARLLPAAAPRGAALFLPFAAQLSGVSPSQAGSPARWQQWLLALIWILLVAAATRPQWLGDPQPVPTTGRRVLLAVDVSGSMSAQDMAGRYTRLQVVQKVAGDFIERRKGDQVGLILFGTRPYLQAPLTPDLDAVRQFLYEAQVGMAGRETAIGDAIGLALKRLRDNGDKGGETVLILLTDGASNAGAMPPDAAAKMAAENGLKIYTIGVGGKGQTGLFGLIQQPSDLDEDTLKSIAKITGGEYFRASDYQDLQKVYARIDQLEPSAGRDQWYRPSTDWYYWPLALALLLSLPTVLLRELRR